LELVLVLVLFSFLAHSSGYLGML